jgi:hypothetical protein
MSVRSNYRLSVQGPFGLSVQGTMAGRCNQARRGELASLVGPMGSSRSVRNLPVSSGGLFADFVTFSALPLKNSQ